MSEHIVRVCKLSEIDAKFKSRHPAHINADTSFVIVKESTDQPSPCMLVVPKREILTFSTKANAFDTEAINAPFQYETLPLQVDTDDQWWSGVWASVFSSFEEASQIAETAELELTMQLLSNIQKEQRR